MLCKCINTHHVLSYSNFASGRDGINTAVTTATNLEQSTEPKQSAFSFFFLLKNLHIT